MSDNVYSTGEAPHAGDRVRHLRDGDTGIVQRLETRDGGWRRVIDVAWIDDGETVSVFPDEVALLEARAVPALADAAAVHPLRELHQHLFPERYEDCETYQWHAGTIEDVAGMIERLAVEHGVEIAIGPRS